jgi:dipeptidyl-peptidase-4
MRFQAAPLALGLLLLAPAAAGQKRLTFEQALGVDAPNFGGRLPPARFTPDGRVEFTEDGKTVLLDVKTGQREEKAPDAAASRPESRPGRGGRARGDGPRGQRRDGSDGRREVHASPDGKLVAYVKDHNLYVEPAAGGGARAVSADGNKELLYGILDWVYQEELYGRGNFRAHWWSPDSRHLAFLRLDESAVKDFVVIDHAPDALDKDKTVRAEVENYPKAGDPNPSVKLGVTRADGGEVTWIDLAGYPEDLLVVRVGWSPDGKQVVFQVQDRIQTWLDLVAADPETGKTTKLLRDTSPGWVNILQDEPRWLQDGTFLWESEKSGFKHLYHHAADGRLLRQVTEGEWQVNGVQRVDEKSGRVWFTATKDGAVGNHCYRTGLDGQGLVRLTTGPGTHRVQWNQDGSAFLDTVSSHSFPPEQRLCDADGKVLAVLGKAEPKDCEAYGYKEPELLAIPSRDGYEIDALLLAPSPVREDRKHPIWVETYSGPDAPSVRDSWNGSVWFQFLAQQGIGVLQVNVRSASGKGQKYTAACYQNFCKSELQDLEDAVEWVAKNRAWADPERVGITGWSFGGTMAAYALTHSKKWKLGVAGAGVYDWRLYDTIYTERYMNLPQSNPQGYKESSCIEAAANLHGHLVLIHGTMDDNVHVQNCLRFVLELQKAGKTNFEMMLYPKSRHGLGLPEQNVHMRRLVWAAIQEHLQPGS